MYYIRLKSKSNRFILGYKIGKRVRCEVTDLWRAWHYETEEDAIAEWKMRQEIISCADTWSGSYVELKNWIVKRLKAFAKIYNLKVEAGRR